MLNRLRLVFAVAAGAGLLVGSASASLMFTEDFSGGALPANMEESTDAIGAVDYSGGNATWALGSARGYVRTIDTDYNTVDFIFEGTLDILDGVGPSGVGIFGLGTGEPDATVFGIPQIPNVHAEFGPDGFANGFVGLNDDHTRESGLLGQGTGWDGVHRVRLTWTAATSTALFEVDQDYAGGPITADYTYTIGNAADNGFDASNSRLFFGGGDGVVWDDISVIPEPATATMLLLGLGALLLRRKRA